VYSSEKKKCAPIKWKIYSERLSKRRKKLKNDRSAFDGQHEGEDPSDEKVL